MGPHGDRPGYISSIKAPWEVTPPPPPDPAGQLASKIAEVKRVYGLVWDDDMVREVAQVQIDHPGWSLWPHIGWGAGTQIIYVKRLNHGMNVIMVKSTEEAREAISECESARSWPA